MEDDILLTLGDGCLSLLKSLFETTISLSKALGEVDLLIQATLLLGRYQLLTLCDVILGCVDVGFSCDKSGCHLLDYKLGLFISLFLCHQSILMVRNSIRVLVHPVVYDIEAVLSLGKQFLHLS